MCRNLGDISRIKIIRGIGVKIYWSKMKRKIIRLVILVQFILSLVSRLHGKEQELLPSIESVEPSLSYFVNEGGCIVPMKGQVIPNSVATLSFKIDEKEAKLLDPHIIKIKGLSCELAGNWSIEIEGKLVKLERDVMKENWVSLGIIETLLGNSTLSVEKTKQCLVSNIDGRLKLTCWGDWIENNDYQVMLYLYTGRLTANGMPVDYELAEQLKGESLLFKMSQLKLVVDYEVVTYTFGIPYISIEEREITLPDQILESILTEMPSVM